MPEAGLPGLTEVTDSPQNQKWLENFSKTYAAAGFFGNEDSDFFDPELARLAQQRVDKLTSKGARRGVEFTDGLPEGYEAFNPTDDISGAMSLFESVARKKGGPPGKNIGHGAETKFRNAMIAKDEEAFNARDQAFADDVLFPMADTLRAQMQELIDKPLFDVETQHAIRSDLMTMARGQEAERLNRVSAVLGLRGLDPSSPAGASIVNRMAEETDARLMTGLRDLNMTFRRRNQEFLRSNVQLGQQFQQSDLALRQQALNPNHERMQNLQLEFAGYSAALHQNESDRKLAEHLFLDARADARGGGSGPYDDIGNIFGAIEQGGNAFQAWLGGGQEQSKHGP